MHGIETIGRLNELADQNQPQSIQNEINKADAKHNTQPSPSTTAQNEALEGLKNA